MTETMKIGKVFRKRLEVFKAFGFKGTALMTTGWRIRGQENRNVWVASKGEYANPPDPIPLGENTLSDDGKRFTDRRDHRRPDAKGYGERLKTTPLVENILFLRTRQFENDRNDVFKFLGVFMPDLENCFQNVCAWKRVSTECTLPDG